MASDHGAEGVDEGAGMTQLFPILPYWIESIYPLWTIFDVPSKYLSANLAIFYISISWRIPEFTSLYILLPRIHLVLTSLLPGKLRDNQYAESVSPWFVDGK